MNPTHETDHNPAHPRAFGKDFLVDLFTTKDRFRAWIASATGTTTPPLTDSVETDPVGYDLTDAGRAALTQPDLTSMTQQEFCRWANPPADAGEPVEWVAVRGWCEICGRALLWVCTWDEPLCSDCVIVVPADNACGYLVTAPDTTASTCPVDLVTETDDETTARVLRDAATYLDRHGWIQGAYYDATSGSFTPPACLVGAIGMVCYGGPVDAPAQHFDDPGFLDFEAAVLHLDRYLLAENGSESYDFNDAKGRQADDVTHVLHDAATRPAHELIDTLRAIDKTNADMTAQAQAIIPCATWNDPMSPEAEDTELTNIVDCQFCGAPGGYPYCQGSFNGQMSCADVVEADDAELAARDGDVR